MSILPSLAAGKLTLERAIYAIVSFGLFCSLVIFGRGQSGVPIRTLSFIKNDMQLLLVFSFFVLALGSLLFFAKQWTKVRTLGTALAVLLPGEIATLYFISHSIKFNAWIIFFSALYLVAAFLYPVALWRKRRNIADKHVALRTWARKQGWVTMGVVLAVMALNVAFGLKDIGKFAAVDEALWTYDRIPNFWKDLAEYDWNGTRVSDKPGLTVAVISGAGIPFEDPIAFENLHWNYTDPGEMESLNKALRIPIYLTFVFFIPILFYFLWQVFGREIALVATILIGLSPSLIGMARIINPDSILWIFTTLSILAYLAYLKRSRPSHLYVSGFFLGLALLTKYVTNLLYVYYLAVIFLEYAMERTAPDRVGAAKHFGKRLTEFGILTLVSLATVYGLYPAIWAKPQRIFLATIQSQAFSSTWVYFVTLIGLLIVDIKIGKAKVLSKIGQLLVRYKSFLLSLMGALFLASVAFVFVNVYGGMKIFDFEAILASPKSSYGTAGLWGVLLANFYPFVFGITPLALFFVLLASFHLTRKRGIHHVAVFYLLFFILFYYAGSAVNQVASPIRYQIMIFPVALIIAAIGVLQLADRLALSKQKRAVGIIGILLVSVYALVTTHPFYLSYASDLLPEKYSLDVKDMGSGSYEAAAYLNTFPDAKNLTVWTDKSGVCNFFVGTCTSTTSSNELNMLKIDYVIISSGRKSRSTKIFANRLDNKLNSEIDLIGLYEGKKAPTYEVKINGRSGQYVRVFRVSGN